MGVLGWISVISFGWEEMIPNIEQYVLPMVVSYHCPMGLESYPFKWVIQLLGLKICGWKL